MEKTKLRILLCQRTTLLKVLALQAAVAYGSAAEIEFSPPGGVYTNPVLAVSLTATAGTIHFTTNGLDPTEASPIYSSALALTNSTLVKARLFEPGLPPNPMVAHAYHLIGDGFTNFSSNLPLVVIDTFGRSVIQEPPPGVPGTPAAGVVIDGTPARSSLEVAPGFNGLCEIAITGNRDLGVPKLPFGLKLKDAAGNDLAAPLLNLPADADWFLVNPYTDKSLMNAFLALELHERMGHWARRRKFVELFIATTGGRLTYPRDYKGVYVLVETIKVATNRLAIAPLTPTQETEPEVSGGYVIRKEVDYAGDLNFFTTGGGGFASQTLKMVYPEPGQATSNQVAWIRGYLNQFGQTLYASDWRTRTGTNHYSAYIDVDSFVDYHWITEFTKNINGYRLGNYLHKDRSGKLKMEPIWDTLDDEIWGLSFGNANYLRGGKTNGWYYADISETDHPWLRRLINGTPNIPGAGGDPDFNQRIADRWGVLRTNILNASTLLQRVDELQAVLNEAAGRDFAQWLRLGVFLWPNPDGPPAWDVDYQHPTSYAGIMAEKKKFIAGRFHWIDSQFTPPPTVSSTAGQVTNGTSVTLLAAPGATVYYTMDGTDPRAPGGDLAPGALSSDHPVVLTVTGTVCLLARARAANAWQNTWSGPMAASFYTDSVPLSLEPLPASDSGAFRFRLVGPPGPVTIQTSADLSGWTNWQSVTLSCGPWEFLDNAAGAAAQRFYRALLP